MNRRAFTSIDALDLLVGAHAAALACLTPEEVRLSLTKTPLTLEKMRAAMAMLDNAQDDDPLRLGYEAARLRQQRLPTV